MLQWLRLPCKDNFILFFSKNFSCILYVFLVELKTYNRIKMNIAMTGATGYIGKHLSNYLTEKGGHRIIPLGRSMFREGMSGYLI